MLVLTNLNMCIVKQQTKGMNMKYKKTIADFKLSINDDNMATYEYTFDNMRVTQ